MNEKGIEVNDQFRIAIFPSLPVAKLEHLLRRLAPDLSQIEVAGVLNEHAWKL